MPTTRKGQVYYQVTKDKPEGVSHVLLIGGSVGAALGFFIVSVVGAMNGTEMDDLVLYFILSAIGGFLAGGFLTLLFVKNFSKVVSASSLVSEQVPESAVANEPVVDPSMTELPVVPGEEDKGQSVDFVFPELSPDK
jgi:phosphate/sulfate permease